MTRVDPDDDTLLRFVARHYRYDPVRRQRRNVVLAAFDDQTECDTFVEQQRDELEALQAAGDAELVEHIVYVVLDPGHREQAQNQRLLFRAMSRGVWPPHWDRDNPPPGVHIITWPSESEPSG